MAKRGKLGSVHSVIVAVLASVSSAHAADFSVPAPVPAGPVSNLLAGFDFTSHQSYFGWIEDSIAPYGLDKSGLRINLFSGGGTYKYNTNGGALSSNTGSVTTSDILLGYGWVLPNFNAKLLIGGNVQDQRLTNPDPNNPVQGERGGFKVQGDFYNNPSKVTMIYGMGWYETTFNSYYSELKWGYDVTGGRGVFIGPQLGAQGNDRYEEWRAGLHVTALKFGPVEVELAGGYLYETNFGSGAYGTVVAGFRF
jgi:Cellulose biosynthesis protein BcsS